MTISVVHSASAVSADSVGIITKAFSSTAGNTLFAIVAANVQNSSWVPSSVTDSAQNTWVPVGTPVASGTNGVVGQVMLGAYMCSNAAAVSQVTASFAGFWDSSAQAIYLFEVSGLTNTSPLDVTATAHNSSGSLTPSATTGNASDFLLAAHVMGDFTQTTSHTADSWTTVSEVNNNGGSLDPDDSIRLNCAYRIVSSTGAQSTTWTTTGTPAAAGLILAVKGGSTNVANASPYWPALSTKVAFGQQPNAAGVGSYTYSTDISQYVQSASIHYGIPFELGQAEAGENQLLLYNADGRFDHGKTSSPYSPNVKDFVPFQQMATWNGVQYGVFTGYMEKWPQNWDDVVNGMSAALGVDAYATLARVRLKSCMQHETLLDNPWGYWPLNDSSGSTYAANLATGSGGNVLLATQPPKRATDATANFGTATRLAGDPSPGWGQTVPTPTNDAGWSLYSRVTGATFPSQSSGNGVTFEMWAQIPFVPQRNDEMTLFALKSSSVSWTDHLIFRLQVDQKQGGKGTLGNLVIQTVDSGGAWHWTDLATRTYCDNRWHHFVVNFTTANTTIWADGVQVYSAARSINSAQIDTIDVGGLQDDWEFTDIGIGTYAHVAAYAGSLSASRIQSHWESGHAGFPEDSGSRINRILTYAGWSGPRVLDLGSSVLGPCATIQGQWATDALNDVAIWEFGLVFVDQLGRFRFQNRVNRFNQTSKGSFGDGSEWVHPEDDISFTYDPTYQYNDIQGQRTTSDGTTGGLFLSGDPNNTIAQLFTSTLQLALFLASDAQVQERISFLYTLLSVPMVRVETFTLIPSNNPIMWPFVLGLNIGDRWTINRRPIGRSDTISVDVIVSAISHEISIGVWKTTVSWLPAVTQATTPGVGPWRLDDSTLSVLGTSTVLGI
jgi:hypothetical protein